MSAGGEVNHLPGVMRAIIGVPIVGKMFATTREPGT